MVSQAKIDANRRNAAKSTGPRTAKGKDKVKFNAVTHGLTAATVVLPHEDKEAYRHRLDAWTRELKAPGDFGQYLVERLVKISWQLDRADTFEQARLCKRIQDAPRLFGASHGEPVETLFARLLETEAETTEQEPVGSRGPRRAGKAGPVPVDEPGVLLRKLESSSDGCRLLLEEWTRLLEWLGRLGPDGLATSEINSKLDNLLRALGLLGVRIADTEAGSGALATANPLAASFLQAWRLVEDRALREFMEQGSDEDDDPPPPEGPELVAPEVMASRWAAVGGALLKLAAERCARLRTLLAGYEQSEAEARARLAYEASFDDSAEGERVHRYQARWGRSLLRTLASLEELRDRGEAVMERGAPPDQGRMSRECAQTDAYETEGQDGFDAGDERSDCNDRVSDLSSDAISSICDEPCSSKTVPGLVVLEQEAVTDQGSSAQQEKSRQNKPTAERSTVAEKGLRALGLPANKPTEATGEHRPDREPDDSGPAKRPEGLADESAHPDSSATSMRAPRSSPGGGGPLMNRYRGELDSGWLDSPPGRI